MAETNLPIAHGVGCSALQGARGLLGDVYLGLRAARSTPGCHMAGFQPSVPDAPNHTEGRKPEMSSLEWVIDQYQVSTDKRRGITNDLNRPGDRECILRRPGTTRHECERQT
jgi:hypothetical protein